MSQLIDKLNQVVRVAPQSMGFGVKRPVPTKPKPLLIARLARSDAARLADYAAIADAVLFTGSGPGAKAAQKPVPPSPGVPWGTWLEDIRGEETVPMAAAGGDFVVFPAEMALAATVPDKAGKILRVEPSINEGLLRAINELPVDAVLLADAEEEKRRLTWHHLMLFQRLADLLTKPVLVSLPVNVTESELQSLWKTGVDGIVVTVAAGQSIESLKELRRTIDKLTFPPRSRGKMEALLPRIGAEPSAVTEVEEEEEEEEE